MINALTPNDLKLHGLTLNLSVPRGVAPLAVASNTQVDNLRAEFATYSDHAGNINLTGPIHTNGLTSQTYITSQTGIGNTFVIQESPTLITPNIGNAIASQITINAINAPPFIVNSSILVPNLYVQRAQFCDDTGNVLITGPINITNNKSYITAQTGVGNVFVMQDNALLNNPDFTTPDIGVATGTSLSVTGQLTTTVPTGTAPLAVGSTTRVANLNVARAGLADSVTTNANLTGPINSIGNTTSVNAQTGNGSVFVMQNSADLYSPTLWTANIGNSNGVNLSVTQNLQATANVISNQLISNIPTGRPPIQVASSTLVNNLYVARSVITDTSGPSSTADSILTEATGLNVNYLPVYVQSNINGYQDLFTNAGWTFNPNLELLTVGKLKSSTYESTITTGTPPLIISSTTKVPNLYVDRSALADTVTINANLTGPIASVGNATYITTQTGTGNVFVMSQSPSLTTPSFSSIINTGTLSLPTITDTLVGRYTTDTLYNKSLITPNIGAATGDSLNVTGQLTSTVVTGTAPLVVSSTTQVPNLYVARAVVADSATTNANLTGVITSIGNATSITAQTGTGTTFVVQNTPTLTTPNIGAATGNSLNVTGQLTSTVATGTAPLVVSSTTKVTNLYADRSALSDTVTTNANLSGVINSVGNTTSINSQTGTGSTFVVQTNPNITNPTISQITNTGILTLPTSTDTLIGRNTTDSLTNKTLTDSTNDVLARGLWTGSGAGSVSVYSATAPVAGQILQAASPTVATWATISTAPTTFSDTSFIIFDNADNTKLFKVDVTGTTGTTTTLATQQTINRTITLPDVTDTVVCKSTTDSLTNKTLTSATNDVTARSLWTGSGAASVSTFAATAPTTGQILTATNSTTAAWSNPAAATNVNLTSNATDLIYYVGSINGSVGSQALQQTGGIYTNASNGNFTVASPGSFFVGGASASINVYATTNQLKLGAAAGPNTTITAPAAPASMTLTLPNALSDTLIARNTTDTLTNKTHTLPRFPGPVITPRTTTVSSGSAINITASSNYYQFITGTTIQRINMPSTSIIGQSYYFVNNSTQVNNVYGSAGGASWNFSAGQRYILIQTVTNGTATTDWDFIQILS